MNSSEYYLERVGFEANVRMRLNLKNGANLIGRMGIKDVDFGITGSRFCSGRHCVITVSSDSKTVGTTINGHRMSNLSVKLEENDVIGIVRGTSVPWNLSGNYDLFVYRLRKYTSDNLLTIEVDDDEISDEDYSNVDDCSIILDPVDLKVEHDLGIQLSRDFNAEIKQELQDFDEFETYCKEMKQEPSNFFEIETTDNDPNETSGMATYDPHLARNEQNYVELARCESNDSSDTVIFSTTHQQDDDQNVDPNAIVLKGCASPEVVIDSRTVNSNITLDSSEENDETVENARISDSKHVDDKLERAVTKVIDSAKRKEGPALIIAKPLKKIFKKDENTKRIDSKKAISESVVKEQRKEKLKTVSASKPKSTVDVIEKSKTTAKVKYTKDNRGSFQMPGLPASVKQRRKSTHIAPLLSLPRKEGCNKVADDGIDIDIEIHSKMEFSNDTPTVDTHYFGYKSKKLSFNDLPKPEASNSDSDFTSTIHNENTLPLPQQPHIDANSSDKPHCSKIKKTDPFVHQVDASKNNHNLPNGYNPQNELKHKVAVAGKASIFQINTCHEIISILTRYDAERYKTVPDFCRSTDSNMNSFGDTFQDYTEYRGSILPLMMLELRKEIEMEFTNSEMHDFTTVTVTDKNVEKRGDGRRMVFHCQVDSLSTSQILCEGHIVLGRYEVSLKKIEFLAIITSIAHVRQTALTESAPIDLLEICPITVIANTLNAFRSVYSLDRSPLLSLILNPLSSQLPAEFTPGNIVYKGYDQLDTDQTSILKSIYKKCINLNVPSISLLDGAAGTGISVMIANLALQLVYGDSLPKPLRILICSRSNRSIDEIALRLLHVCNITCVVQKIQLVRFGLMEQMDKSVRSISVQHMRENEQRFLQLANLDKLEKEKKTLELKVRALELDDDNDHEKERKLMTSKLIKVNTLIRRLEDIDKSKLKDPTTILLNACDIICTTLGSMAKLQNYIPNVDMCIIDEATQCNESLTLLPFQFGMSSLVLVGDSRLPTPMVYSEVAHEKNYGKSLFKRFHDLFVGKSGSPIRRIYNQHRMHPEILKWPNKYFYNNSLRPVEPKAVESFPIVPYKMLSYSPVKMESDNIMLVINVLLSNIDWKKYSVGLICTNFKQKSIMQNKMKNHPHIATFLAAESVEKDVIIIWISKEYGMRHLYDHTLFNRAVTRARRCLLICGADLMSYKSRSIWKSMLENAQERKCFHHMKALLQPKIENILRKKKSLNHKLIED